jgi:hypothetical protein
VMPCPKCDQLFSFAHVSEHERRCAPKKNKKKNKWTVIRFAYVASEWELNPACTIDNLNPNGNANGEGADRAVLQCVYWWITGKLLLRGPAGTVLSWVWLFGLGESPRTVQTGFGCAEPFPYRLLAHELQKLPRLYGTSIYSIDVESGSSAVVVENAHDGDADAASRLVLEIK